MATDPTHEEVEQRFRELIAEAGLPDPDDVAYEPRSVVFLWNEQHVAVAVDLDDPIGGAGPAEPSSRPTRARRVDGREPVDRDVHGGRSPAFDHGGRAFAEIHPYRHAQGTPQGGDEGIVT
jgi:hypothetical protein